MTLPDALSLHLACSTSTISVSATAFERGHAMTILP